MMNWYAGWGMILTAFVTGAILGLFFYREGFLGGYASFRRRLIRLGHIALAALGMVNLLFALSPWPEQSHWQTKGARIGRLSIRLASSSPTNCSFAGSHASFRPPRRSEMLPIWQTLTERWPISASQVGTSRERTQSKKLRMWFSLT